MDQRALKELAARLVLGEDLAKELIEDSWNASNDLGDPFEVRNGTARFSVSSARLGAKALSVLMAALDRPAMEFAARYRERLAALSEEEREAWRSGGKEPTVLSSLTCMDMGSSGLEELVEGLEAEVGRLGALVENKLSDVRLVEFKDGHLDLRGSVVLILAEGLAQSLGHGSDERELANYVEASLHHAELGEITMTIQRKRGKTAHQIRNELEAENARLRARITLLEDEKG